MEQKIKEKANLKGDSKKFRKLVKLFWFATFGGILIVCFLLLFISLGWIGYMPDVEELEKPRTYLATEILSSDQKTLGLFFNENRTVAELDNISPFLMDALVATEDARFYDHSGIDVISLMRVLFKTVLLGKSNSGGGSTISQQLAKNLMKTREKEESMLITKLKEWVIAVRLEKRYTKEEIITMYLNTVEYGSNAFGINAAAWTYFNKKPDQLIIEEAAILIGVLKANTYYNPHRNPKNATKRRNVVFGQMQKYGYITQAEFDSLKEIPLKLNYRPINYNTGLAPYFRAYLKRIMNAKEPDEDDSDYDRWKHDPLYGWCNKNFKPDGSKYDLNTDGLKIYSTINASMQQYAEDAVRKHFGKDLQKAFNSKQKGNSNAPYPSDITKAQFNENIQRAMEQSDRYLTMERRNAPRDSILKAFDKRVQMTLFSWKGDVDTNITPRDSIIYMKHFLHAGFFSVEPQTGYVRAYVGGIDHKYFEYDHVVYGKRQVGSTVKPFIYATAMDRKVSPCVELPNINTVFIVNGKEWSPAFSEKPDKKMVSLKEGLAFSMNQISAALLKQYGTDQVIAMMRKLGIKSDIEPVPSLCVGAPDISLYEMIAAYATLANEGVYIEPMFVARIEDRYGNPISTFTPYEVREAISEETAYLTLELMKGVIEFGTSTRIKSTYGIKAEIAGKTGTTNNNSDGWFIGITPELVSGVWTGGDERSIRFTSTSLGQGANMALPIWALYMQKVYADKKLNISTLPFKKPEYLSVEIDCDKFREEENGKLEFD